MHHDDPIYEHFFGELLLCFTCEHGGKTHELIFVQWCAASAPAAPRARLLRRLHTSPADSSYPIAHRLYPSDLPGRLDGKLKELPYRTWYKTFRGNHEVILRFAVLDVSTVRYRAPVVKPPRLNGRDAEFYVLASDLYGARACCEPRVPARPPWRSTGWRSRPT